MKPVQTILLVIFSFMMLIAIMAIVKGHQYGTLETYMHKSKRDCSTNLPADLQIVYSSVTKRYAVKYNWSRETTYLWGQYSGLITWSYDVNTDFSDSCRAKSFALEFHRKRTSESDRKNSYK